MLSNIMMTIEGNMGNGTNPIVGASYCHNNIEIKPSNGVFDEGVMG